MKYRFSYLPNVEKAKNFKVTSQDNKNASTFKISKEVLIAWGNPKEARLEHFMVAYIKKNGWTKEVTIDSKDTTRNLNNAIAELNGSKSSPAAKKPAKK
jgi:hypothetical protein